MALKNVIFLFILYQFKFDGRCSLLWRLQLDFKILKTCKIHINCQGWKVKKFERWKWKMIFWFLFLGLSFDKWYSAKVETDPINKQSKHHLVITNKRFWERRNIFLSLVSFQCQSLSNLYGAKVNVLMDGKLYKLNTLQISKTCQFITKSYKYWGLFANYHHFDIKAAFKNIQISILDE